jgi:hypothetical protein
MSVSTTSAPWAWAAPGARPRWHGFHRGKHGGLVIDDEMTMCLGFLFWAAVGAAAYFLLR